MSYIKRPAIFGVSIASLALLALSSLTSQAGVSTTLRRSPASPRSIIRIEEDKPNIVLPAQAKPLGYSLADAASITAAFNTTDHCGEPPDLPLQMLYPCGSGAHLFEVQQGTYFYVPIFYVDDSPPVIGHFPDISIRTGLQNYMYSQNQVGVVFAMIEVDGWHYVLTKNYLVGVDVSPLPDGGGTRYATVAAFLKPLSVGTHTIEVEALATGRDLIPWCGIVSEFLICKDAIESKTSYTVTVK